jgi:hypothetical protein
MAAAPVPVEAAHVGSGRRVGNLLVGAAWALWCMALAWAALHAVAGVVFPCETYWYDSSSSGTPAWQWFPPGYACTYTAADSDAITVVTSPGFANLAVALLLLAFPLYAIAQRRLSRKAENE